MERVVVTCTSGGSPIKLGINDLIFSIDAASYIYAQLSQGANRTVSVHCVEANVIPQTANFAITVTLTTASATKLGAAQIVKSTIGDGGSLYLYDPVSNLNYTLNYFAVSAGVRIECLASEQ